MTIGLPHQLRTIIFRSVGNVEVSIKGFAYLLQSKPYCPLCNRSVARNMNDFDGFTAVTACKTTHHFTFYAICVPLVFARCSVNYQPSSWRMHQNSYMGQSVPAKFCHKTALQTCSSSEYEISWLPCCRIRKWHGGWGYTLTAGIEDNSRYQEKHIFYKKESKTSIDEEVLK